MIRLNVDNIEARYALHRQRQPKAITWDKVIDYAINGDEFGTPLKNWQWHRLTLFNKNTIAKWVPLIQQYIRANDLLNEDVADAIVQSVVLKQKQKGKL